MNLPDLKTSIDKINPLQPSIVSGIFEIIEQKTSDDMKEVINEIKLLRAEMNSRFEQVELKMKTETATLHTEIAQSKISIILWIGGILLAIAITIFKFK